MKFCSHLLDDSLGVLLPGKI